MTNERLRRPNGDQLQGDATKMKARVLGAATAASVIAALVLAPWLATQSSQIYSGPSQHFTLCAAPRLALSPGVMAGTEDILRARLAGVVPLKYSQVQNRGDACFRIFFPESVHGSHLVQMLTRPDPVALTDAGSTYLAPGTPVKLACPEPDVRCIAGGLSGVTNLRARPLRILQVVVGPRHIEPNAQVVRGTDGSASVNYTLDRRGSAQWCAFTSTHARHFSAIVVNNKVFSDPKLTGKVCRSQTQITGLGSARTAAKLAAELGFGSLSGGTRFLEVWPGARSARPASGLGLRSAQSGSCLRSAKPPLCYSPQQLRTAYDVDPLLNTGIDGKGRTIVITAVGLETPFPAGLESPIRSSVRNYDELFGLPSPALRFVSPSGNFFLYPSSLTEVIADIEVTHMIAPAASILVDVSDIDLRFSSPTLSYCDWLRFGAHAEVRAIDYAVTHNLGDVINASYALREDRCGRSVMRQLHRVLQLARSKGISVVASSGDEGALGQSHPAGARGLVPRATFPASDPLVTAVGGTSLVASLPDGGYGNETVWNQSIETSGNRLGRLHPPDMASAGGASTIANRPSYQTDISTIGSRRAVPDVAFDADTSKGIASVLSRGRTIIVPLGGTSLGAPAWAGIFALADQFAGRRLGFLNAAIYRIGRDQAQRRAFHDVTSGNSSMRVMGSHKRPFVVRGFKAQRGWDEATGWGSPDVAALVPLLVRNDHSGDGSRL